MTIAPDPRALRVHGADGLVLAGWDYGGHGEPLCFFHGFGHDHHVWDEVAPAFVGTYRVLAFDLRGHGASDRDSGFHYHHASLGKDIAAVVAALGAERVALVAHSTAGHASIGYAARFPDRVSRLVLVEAGPELRVSGGEGGGARGPKGGDGSFASIADYAAVLGRFHPRARPELLSRLASLWLRQRDDGRYELTLDPAFWRPRPPRAESDPARPAKTADAAPRFDRKAWAEQGEAALWRDLAAIRSPVLVVRGADSPMLSAATVTRMTREVLADGKAVEIPGAGHVPMIDNPAMLLVALGALLRAA